MRAMALRADAKRHQRLLKQRARALNPPVWFGHAVSSLSSEVVWRSLSSYWVWELLNNPVLVFRIERGADVAY
jgi:hypothetical protein